MKKLVSNCETLVKLFVDGISLFFAVNDITYPTTEPNSNLTKNEKKVQWKTAISPDPLKQAQDVIFFRNIFKSKYPEVHSKYGAVNFESS